MDGPRDYQTKWSKPDRERQISPDIAYMWNPKKKKRYKWTIQNINRPNRPKRESGGWWII